MTTESLTDLGPAPSPPVWCLPDTEPNTDSTGNGHLWVWSREFDPHVWIECEDRIVDGRMMRSAPRIVYAEPPAAGVTCEYALELARGLTAAADVIATSALEESQP